MRVKLLILAIMFALSGDAQSHNVLVGTWKLISATETTAKRGIRENPFSPSPLGFLTYTADGRVMVIITYGGRRPLSIKDCVSAPEEERAEAFATMFAYAGRYSLSEYKVTHHVEAASVSNWVDTDLVRMLKIEGDRLSLHTSGSFEEWSENGWHNIGLGAPEISESRLRVFTGRNHFCNSQDERKFLLRLFA